MVRSAHPTGGVSRRRLWQNALQQPERLLARHATDTRAEGGRLEALVGLALCFIRHSQESLYHLGVKV